MTVIDREPTANIISLEGPFIRPVLFEVPVVSKEAFTKLPQREEIVGVGRNRFKVKLETILSEGITLIRNAAEFVRNKGRGGRGPCSGCLSGTEQNHHFGSKCTRRGIQGSGLLSKSASSKATNINKTRLALNPSGLY